jgi:hypothetical protein
MSPRSQLYVTLTAASLAMSAPSPLSAQDTPAVPPPSPDAVAPTPPTAAPTPVTGGPVVQTPVPEPPPAPAPRHRPQAGELFPFVLPWDDTSPSVANLTSWHPTPAGRNGFVYMKDGHLWEPSAGEGPTARLAENPDPASPRRLRLLGVNLCFDANFPSKEDAPKVAARMAKFGINCVRFHHMEFYPAPRGIVKEDLQTLDPENLDKLDFFIAELKKRGIYSDLNLHVSRVYPGFPKEWPGGPSFHKGVDQFQPELIQSQKDFARDLLRHVNPYTGLSYLDEPAVVLVEINNENGLMFQWHGRDLDEMPDPFKAELNRQWTRWLLGKYPPGDTPQPLGPKAWGVEEVPLEDSLLKPLAGTAPEGWYLEQHKGAKAALSEVADPAGGAPWAQVEVQQPADEIWYIQLSHAGLKLEGGKPYTLEMEVQGKGLKDIHLTLMQAQDPWEQLATLSINAPDENARTVKVTMTPSRSEDSARLVIGGLGRRPAGSQLRVRNLTLRPGGMRGVDLTQDALSYRFLKKIEFGSATVPQKQDWLEFLWTTEDAYWREMDHYLREELGVKSLIVGTQAAVFSNMALQSRFPVIDTHAYWKHPRFPGASWSPTEWVVDNEAMSARADGGELGAIGVNRVAGKAFIVTEYNHPQPMSYAAEAFPLMAAVGAWQDWDGLFPFAYSHGGKWDQGFVGGFFDIKQDPLKMATLPMAAALFLRGDMVAPTAKEIGPVSAGAFRSAMMGGSTVVDATSFGATKTDVTKARLYTKIGEGQAAAEEAPAPPAAPGTPHLQYVKPPGAAHSLVLVTAPRSKAVIGHTGGRELDLGDGVKVSGVKTRLPEDWGIVTLSQMTGESVTTPGRILLLAMSDQENTDLKWNDEKKNSVGKNWGKAPSRVECITAQVTLPVDKDSVQVWSLDERGQPLEALPISGGKTSAVINLKPEYGTVWYEVIVQ